MLIETTAGELKTALVALNGVIAAKAADLIAYEGASEA